MRIPLAGECGSIVVGWLTRLVVVFAVLGVLAFDAVSVGVAQLAVTDSASRAAREASLTLTGGGTAQQAYEAAVDSSRGDEAGNEVPVSSFLVGADRSVSLTVQRTAPTLVLHHLPGSESWLLSSASASRGPG